MILQNNKGENKIFIDDSLINNSIRCFDYGHIIFSKIANISFTNENIYISNINEINFDDERNSLLMIDEYGYRLEKIIDDDEIISIGLDSEDNVKFVVNIYTMKLPKFLFQDNYDDKYPKFEVNLSDCTYSIKIYINDSEYIDMPMFQSHNNIHSTLDYISQLVFYLTEGRPEFFYKLCIGSHLDLIIHNEEHEVVGGENLTYKLGEDGIYLTGGELENYRVEWNTFFKLIMDGKWEAYVYNEE